MEKWVTIWGIAAIVAMIAGAVLAYSKRLDSSAWAAWCFLFPPAIIVLALLPRNKGERPTKPSLDEDDNYGRYKD